MDFVKKDKEKVGQFGKNYLFYLEGFHSIIINLLLGIIIINLSITIIISKPILLVEEVRHNVIVRLHQRGLVAHSEVIVPCLASSVLLTFTCGYEIQN